MRTITHTFMIALGWILLIPGLIFVVLPPPFAFGIFMVVPAVAILVAYSKGMRRLVQSIRARHSIVNTSLGAVEDTVPGWVSRSLKRTNPAARIRALRRKHKKTKTKGDMPAEPVHPAPLNPDVPHG